MRTLTWQDLFGPPTGKRNPRRTLANAQWQTLESDVWFNGCEYAKESQYKVWEGADFGYVCFRRGTQTPNGLTPGRLLHRY